MHYYKSPLGINVVHVPMDSKTICAGYVFDVGSRNEFLPREYGLFHCLEHMVLGDTAKIPWKDTSSLFQKWGVDYNAFTSDSQTFYYINCLEEFFPEIFHRLSSCIFETIFQEEKWAVEQKAILNEIMSSAVDPADNFKTEISQSAFGKAAHCTLGASKNIEKLQLKDLAKLYNKFYSTKIATLFIAGGDAKAIRHIVECYRPPENLNNRSVTLPAPRYNKNFNTKPYYVECKLPSRSIHLATRPISLIPTLSNLAKSHLIEAMYSNMLQNVVRQELGVCYETDTTLFTVNKRFYLEIVGFTDPETDLECRAAINLVMENPLFLQNKMMFSDYFESARNSVRMEQEEHHHVPKFECLNLLGLYNDGIFSPSKISREDYSSDRIYEEIRKVDLKETLQICQQFIKTPYKKASLFGSGV